MKKPPDYAQGPHGRIAYHKNGGKEPGFVWLGGFRSDMDGTKALHTQNFANRAGRAFLRFDYSGHGASAGRFEDGTVGRWTEDALFALDTLTSGPQVLVGSSMGGWIAALAAVRRPRRVSSLVLIAPAPDFTEKLLWPALDAAQKAAIMTEGRLLRSREEGADHEVITRALIEDGQKHLLMTGPVPVRVPVRIIQGMNDTSVPWAHAVAFAGHMETDDVLITLVKDGDHRLGRPEDLARLTEILGRT